MIGCCFLSLIRLDCKIVLVGLFLVSDQSFYLNSDFSEGGELSQERQVSGILRYLDSQFADTMREVSGDVFQP